MIVTKCYRYRLNPTKAQEALFIQFAGCRRFVWNWALARKQEQYKATGKGIADKRNVYPGFAALCAELTGLKKQADTAFLKEAHSQVLQQTLMDLEKAFSAFFEKRARKNGGAVYSGFPKFKSRKTCPHAFRIAQNVSIDGQFVSIPKVGRVKAIIHRPTEGVLKSATIKQEAGAWFVVFVAHVDVPDVAPTCTNPVGLDVGLESFVTLSTGEKVKPPKFYRKGERKLARLNRALARCQKQSHNRVKAKAKLARHHQKVKNQRSDWLHKLSANLVGRFDTICIEDLNLKGLVRTKLSKSFSDAGIGEFLRQLTYKAAWNLCKRPDCRGQVLKVGRFFPSSKTCSDCGGRANLSLSDREWLCGHCGAFHDRDVNAAVNILHEALCIERLAPVALVNASPSLETTSK